MQPIDFLTHVEFNPFDWLIWFDETTTHRIQVSEFMTVYGKRDALQNFNEKFLCD